MLLYVIFFLSTFDYFSAEYAVCLHFCCLFCGLRSKWETARKTKCKYIFIFNYIISNGKLQSASLGETNSGVYK